MQHEKHYQLHGFIYKIGLRGMVFVKTINGWIRSTVTAEELYKAENQRIKRTPNSFMKNVNDYKLA